MLELINQIFSNLVGKLQSLFIVSIEDKLIYFIILKKYIIFASTVPVLLPIRTAHGSFFFIGSLTIFQVLFNPSIQKNNLSNSSLYA